ncbi:MAG: hypothetical protein ACOYIF_06060 [Acetivibrionales bacterium]
MNNSFLSKNMQIYSKNKEHGYYTPLKGLLNKMQRISIYHLNIRRIGG